MLCSPGLGKTRASLLIMDSYYKEDSKREIYVSLPRMNLQNTWVKEMKENNFNHLLEITVFTTHASLYKIDNIHLLVIDEVDKSITPKKHINLGISEHVLGITGTLTEPKRLKALEYGVEVLKEVSVKDAVKYGFINDTKYGIVRYDLSDEKNIPIKMKNGNTFMTSDASSYEYYDIMFNEAKEDLYCLGYSSIGNNVYKYLQSKTFRQDYPIAYKEMLKYSRGINGRKKVLRTSKSSLQAVRLIHRMITNGKLLDVPEARFIVFHEDIETLEKLVKHVVHSKTKSTPTKSAKFNATVVEDFNNKLFNSIGAAKMLSEGHNLIDLYIALHPTYNSSTTEAIQQNGRLSRLDKDSIGYNIYFVARNTVQEVWLKNCLKDIDIDFKIEL